MATPIEQLRMTWDSESQADWPVAGLLATLSLESYSSPVEAEVAFHSLGFERITTVTSGYHIGYIVSIEDATVVVFRGTDDIADWLANLDINSHSTVHGSFHRGFYSAFESLKSQIATPLFGDREKRTMHEDNSIWSRRWRPSTPTRHERTAANIGNDLRVAASMREFAARVSLQLSLCLLGDQHRP